MHQLKTLFIISLIAASGTSYALPFMPMDARGLAMGGTGVASSRLAHSQAYNPSLLTKAEEDDDFSILFPQIGIVFSDEGDVINDGKKIVSDTLPKYKKLFEDKGTDNFKSSIQNLQTASKELITAIDSTKGAVTGFDSNNPATYQASINDIKTKNTELKTKNEALRTSITSLKGQIDKVNATTAELNKKLGDISGDPLKMRVGIATAFAFPSKKLAVGVNLRNDVHLSGRATITERDRNLLAAYGLAARGYSDGADAAPNAVGKVLGSIDTFISDVNKKIADPTAATPTVPDAQSFTNIKSDVESVKNYNSDEVNTAGGKIRIIENGQLSNAAKQPKLESTVQIVGMNTSELGLSFAREFMIEGEKVSFGVTPKVVAVQTFHYGTSMENKVKINNDTLQSARTSHIGINLDLGASYRFGDDSGWMAGATIKNLIPKSYKTKDTKLKDENGIETGKTVKGPELKINPQLRVGGSYENSWFMGTAELDITENEPVAFEAPTRYLAAGAEFDLLDTAQFRLGARTNLSADSPLEQSVLSLGIGFSPSILEMNLALMANPSDIKREAGLAFELGLAF